MKTYKNFMTESAEHIIELLLEKDLRNLNAPELAPLLRILKQSPQATIDRAYEAVFVPNMEARISQLFDNRGMTTGKVEVAKEALMSKIIKINAKVEEKLDFIKQITPDLEKTAFELVFDDTKFIDFDMIQEKVEDAGFFIGNIKIHFEEKLNPNNNDHAVYNNNLFHFIMINNANSSTYNLIDKNFISENDFES
jgi:hypothetical protein